MFEILISLHSHDTHVSHKLTFVDEKYETVRAKMAQLVKELEAISTKPLKVRLVE